MSALLKKIFPAFLAALSVLLVLQQSVSAKPKKAKPISKTSAVISEAKEEDKFELPEKPALDDYLAFAALRNNGLKAAYYRWRASLEVAPQVTTLPYPKLSYGYFIKEVETRVGPQRQRIGISQSFPYPGKLKQMGAVASAQSEIAKQEFESLKYSVFRKVKEAYYDYVFLAQSISVMEENIKLLEFYNKIIETKLKVGQADQTGLLKAQVELENLRDRLAALKEMRSTVAAKLNAAIDMPADTVLPWPENKEGAFLEIDRKSLAETLSARAPKLLVADKKIGMAQEGIRMAEYENKPNFMFSLDYIDTGRSDMRVDDNGKDPVVAMIQVELPFWRKKAKALKNEQRIKLAVERASKRELENNLQSSLSMELYNLEDAKRRYDLYAKSLLPKAEQSLKASETAYSNGKLDFLNLLDSQRVLLMFRLNKDSAYRDYWKAVAGIEEITGANLNETKKENKDNE